MRVFGSSLLIGAVVLSACSEAGPAGPAAPAEAPLLAAGPADRGIEGSYVVVLRDGVRPGVVAAAAGVRPARVYRSVLNGFAAELAPGQLAALRAHPGVEYVEQDRVVTAAETQYNAPWGLDRIDQRLLPLSTTYTYFANGSGVYAYVIDTGIDASHPEFGGRAANVFDVFGGSGHDCHGHGTAVAGIVGAKTFGVAKGVKLLGVRVLDCNGSGTVAGIITALDWVRADGHRPAVANVSLNGSSSLSMNTAVGNLAASGVFVAVAAGNSNANACNYSPSAAAKAFTTAATDRNDFRMSSSNYGRCVDAYAPGVLIPTIWTGGLSRTLSGTSAASPHVAGVGALYKSAHGEAPSDTVSAWITRNATPGVVIGNPPDTPNLLLYMGGL